MKLHRQHILFVLLLIICMGHGDAASQTFNKRIDLFDEGNSQLAWGVEVTAEGVILVLANGGYTVDGLYSSSGFSTVKITMDGEILDQFRLQLPNHASYVGWSNSADPDHDGGFISGGGTYNNEEGNRAALFWLDDNGVVYDHRQYLPAGTTSIGRKAISTPDGGYLLCGTVFDGETVTAFLLKTDQNGDPEWAQTYGSPGLNSYLASLAIDGEGGFFAAGIRRVTANDLDQWLLHVDANGEVISNTFYGTPYTDENIHLNRLASGDLILAGPQTMGLNGHRKLMLKKVDPNGAEVWSGSYGGVGISHQLFVAWEIEPGGDLITGGQHAPSTDYHGVMLRTTSEGDSLWMRYYQYHDSLVTNGRGFFRDVMPTPDGGFVAVGYAGTIPGIYTQDIWVVKVDEHGCIEPGCHIISGMETQITNMRDVLKVWPNPVAAGPVQVAWELPEHFVPQGQLKLTITSGDGRLVHEERVSPLLGRGARGEGAIQLPQLSPGLYHFHLSDASRWISGAKLVVE